MAHRYKTIEMKADENGIIEGYFSTYDKEPDSYGDIIEPGAFTETIKKREETGHPFPLCFNHDFSAVIGAVDSVKDTEKGPYIKAHFLDTQQAQDVRKMLLSGAIYQFSFAYDILEARRPTEEEKKLGIWSVLEKLEVFEISVVTFPANQNAVATEVKSAEPETKSGKRNSKADEDIIRENIRELADMVDDLNDLARECEARIESLGSLIEGRGDEDNTEDNTNNEENDPKANAENNAEEQKGAVNSDRVEALLEKIKAIKGGSNS